MTWPSQTLSQYFEIPTCFLYHWNQTIVKYFKYLYLFVTGPNYQRIPWQYLMWFMININEDQKNLWTEILATKAPKILQILFVALNIKLSKITLSSMRPVQLLDQALKFDFDFSKSNFTKTICGSPQVLPNLKRPL